MSEKVASIFKKMKELEHELEEEITRVGKDLKYRVEGKKVLFEKSVIEYHRTVRKSVYRLLRDTTFKGFVVAAGVYIMFVPVILIDLATFIFQITVFPLLRLERIPRSEFVFFDRHKLAHLNIIEKIGCAYCSYANGVAAYYSEVAGATESYYCPMKHAKRVKKPHAYYHEFIPYGHAEEYRKRINKLRGIK